MTVFYKSINERFQLIAMDQIGNSKKEMKNTGHYTSVSLFTLLIFLSAYSSFFLLGRNFKTNQSLILFVYRKFCLLAETRHSANPIPIYYIDKY